MDSGEPLYAHLKECILRDIHTGALKPADKLPSQRELCEQFKMSHMTVRRAISELLNEGAIYAIPGKGIYVAEKKKPAETSMMGFTGEMAQRGYATSSRVIEKGLMPASSTVANALGISVGTELAYLYRLRFVKDEPISLARSYLVHNRCPGLLEHIQDDSSLYEILFRVYGLQLVNFSTTVEATLAQKVQARLLQLTQPTALLLIDQVNHNTAGEPVEYSRLAYRGDRYVMQTKLQHL